MTTIDILKKFESYPTFTVDTLANILHKDPAYAKLYLSRLKHRGLIKHLQRNVYTTQHDPLIVASHIIWPSYISLWTALRYHDLTEQIPTTISVVTPRSKTRTTIHFENTTIEFHHIRPAWFFGYEKTRISDFEVFIAEPEKALIDALLLKAISATEVYAILTEYRTKFSSNKIITYSLQTKNKALIKRIGWMLSSLHVASAKRLQKHSYPTVIPFDYARSAVGKRDTTWGLILNNRGIKYSNHGCDDRLGPLKNQESL